jgi:threonyl-tRNA synthetase
MQYAELVLKQLKASGIRGELDMRDEKLGYKIREARLDKVPYMIVVGKKEQEDNLISVRGRDVDEPETMSVEEFVRRVAAESSI